MENGPDRVWAYSGFLRDCFEKNGIEKNIIDIVPPGLDPETYRPGAGSDEELGKDTRFKFLFVGGTIFRKGIDILLRAYAARFAFRDDVLLVIKDYPCNSVYENAGFSGVIGKLKTIKGMPAIRHITEDLPDRRMAGLYASCDCLVAPYRAEGFGMPIIEALACGCPAIVTGYGAALDFCREGPCRLVSAEVKESGEKKILGMETSVSPFWAEADAPALAEAMGQVRENAGPMKKNALEYAAEILKNYCWKNVAEHAFEKIKNLF
jgi:glycosyltransferase involved in cell wall biosynthesis